MSMEPPSTPHQATQEDDINMDEIQLINTTPTPHSTPHIRVTQPQLPASSPDTIQFSAQDINLAPPAGQKRFSQPSFDIPLPKHPRLFTSSQTNPQGLLLKAQDLILQAALASNGDVKERTLKLLDIFREYTQTGEINKASKVLALQITQLERVNRSLEAKANQASVRPAIPKKPTFQPSSQPTSKPSSQQTFQPIRILDPRVERLANEVPAPLKAPNQVTPITHISTNPEVLQWHTVSKKSNTAAIAKSSNASQAKKAKEVSKSKRLILVAANTALTPLHLRNAINNSFDKAGIKGPVVNSVTKSITNNCIVTTTAQYSGSFLLDKIDIWKNTIHFAKAQLDEPWFKVILHGIPTADFNTEGGMDLIHTEITTFNEGYTPIGTPYWLTSQDKRANQRAGSVVVAFKTELEAKRAIRHRLYVAGISVRVEKLFSTPKTTQCSNCQSFGHLSSYCKHNVACRLCAENHPTAQHNCNICKAKGRSCIHLAPKCKNCKEPHVANSRDCEVMQALRSTNGAGQAQGASRATTGKKATESNIFSDNQYVVLDTPSPW